MAVIAFQPLRWPCLSICLDGDSVKLPYSIIDSGVLGRHTMNVVVISAVTGAMDAPLHFSSSFFVPVGPCAGAIYIETLM